MKLSATLISAVAIVSVLFAVWNWGPWAASQVSGTTTSAGSANHAPAAPDNPPAPSDVGENILAGEIPELTPTQIAAFVKATNSAATSLIAAWDLSGDETWLLQAADDYPDDPRVAVAMLLHGGVTSEDAAHWIETLARTDPGNAAGNLYAARAALASGEVSQAVIELTAMEAADRTDFFTDSSSAALVAAYKHAGHRGPAGEWAAFAQVKIPSGEMVGLSRDVANAMIVAHASGDENTALALGQAGMAAAASTVRNDGSDYLISQLIGVSMQRKVLHQLDEFDLVPGEAELVIERLAELDGQIADIRQVMDDYHAALPTMTDAEAGKLIRRIRSDGELSAMRWLIAQRQD